MRNVCRNDNSFMRGNSVHKNRENVLLLHDNNKINVSVAGHGFNALVDSGSTISTISGVVFHKICKNMQVIVNNNTNCNFKNMLEQTQNKITILNLNCQSLSAKFDNLKLFPADTDTH